MPPTWGIVTTVKAPLDAIMDFAAWHLSLGAHRIYLHLDAPDEAAMAALKSHPKIRVTPTGESYWSRNGGRRPAKHQVRQGMNASRILSRPPQVDWLAHIDVDEFIVPDKPVAEVLAAQAPGTKLLRMRPIEALAPVAPVPGVVQAKAMSLDRATRRAQTERIYPDYARGLDGGFLSHVAGKLLVHTSLAGSEIRIHNVFRDGVQNPGHAECPALPLLHMHAPDVESWLAHYRFRLKRGSYRSELKPPLPAESGGLTLHDMLAAIEAEAGEDGLRRFFAETCTATPDLLDRLRAEGLLREVPLDLAAARRAVFG
ncbi:glycosyltransferase family 2 protein [Pseudooceanicola sp. 216_PA32_1]|uniref:Glycosyltransferase family 2 protein n=1 Tax=Pseudooceanicola pacificus TaxID=2676438 RepID=A0A844W8R4_9RHOB|nr:glycosyltransferase family 2 protein [Pseudooceanicola pacificus]MWB79535.1 glycosyltransferase family 2 protein [Pseudooceanicola pacificus]